MLITVEAIPRHSHRLITEVIQHDGDPVGWTADDVGSVLREMLRVLDRASNPEADAERPVVLRGINWIVHPAADGVVLALEVSSGQAVAGPFEIDGARLTALVTEAMTEAPASTVH